MSKGHSFCARHLKTTLSLKFAICDFLCTEKFNYLRNDENYLYLNHGASDTVPEIIFNKDANLETILEDLSLAMGKKEFADAINSGYNKLLYIDLRFKNKVLYKFQ